MSIKGFNVNGTVERYDYTALDNLPESALFKASYGTTTASEITQALNDGKICYCIYGAATYYLTNQSGGIYVFTTIDKNINQIQRLRVLGSTWSWSFVNFQELLDFDDTPTSGSDNPVTSDGIYQAIQAGGGGGTSDYTDLTNKPQINGNTLTGNKTAANLGLATPSDIPAAASSGTPAMNGTASRGSSAQYARADHVHPTDTSRAAASDLAAKADKVTEVTVSTAGAVTQALDAGKIYHFTGALTALTITLNAPASGGLAQYHFDFNSGSTAATLTMPNTVTMPDSFAPEASKHYEVDVLNNYGAVMAWAT